VAYDCGRKMLMDTAKDKERIIDEAMQNRRVEALSRSMTEPINDRLEDIRVL
jgi:hypothetical protein